MRQPAHSALLTDLYELTMAAAYFDRGFEARATFELFVRDLPRERGFLLVAGLEQALEFLEDLHFTADDIDYLRRHPAFGNVSSRFYEYLREFHFTGEVWAIPEGTPAFRNEPLLRVTAPIIEAQVVETFLLTTITFQTMIATKAARVVQAADGRGVVEFGTRRAHGPEAGTLAARAAFIGGCIGTSNVEAGRRFGIPTYGTLAHSYVMAHSQEDESFRDFLRTFPQHAVLLVDTYDTLAAIDRIVALGLKPRGVRLDSGDLVELSRQTRRRLRQAGLGDTQIFASGDLDEFVISDALRAGAEVDAFGVGTALATSKDEPALGGVYKLVEIEMGGKRQPCAKFSPAKATYPGPKQVFRFSAPDGTYDHDLIARDTEQYPDAEPLLSKAMEGGKPVAPSPPLGEVQQRARRTLARLPQRHRALRDPASYSVEISSALETLMEEVRSRILPAVAKEDGR
ncbi:MAG TPA: nicotinate phosphoribosyltransferase [Terriglobales bacterium]|nr:nicotinate phosphoribosyltransferase [Terriglobales bacterium]